MYILSSPPQPSGVQAVWTLKRKDPRSGRYVPVLRRRNKFTDAGLTNLAQSWAGAGAITKYLIIDQFKGLLQNATLAVGSTALQTDVAVHKTGDSALVIDVGAGSQETVGWNAVSGSGPFTYTLTTPTTLVHSVNAWVTRPPQQSDLLADIKSEVQYDAVAAPGARMAATGSGYSGGTGNYAMQFYLTGNQALVPWVSLGLSATSAVGSGALMNHLLFGFNHTVGNDVELDISLTLSNS